MEGIKQKIWAGFKDYWINVLYITLFLSVFTDYTRLILTHYGISYTHYGISLINGLILAKVILIAEHLHIGQGFEDKPLIIPTIYKSFLFTICVIFLITVEPIIRAVAKSGDISVIPNALMSTFSCVWFAKILVVFVLFIPFFGMRELARVLGKGKISELFFKKRAFPGNSN